MVLIGIVSNGHDHIVISVSGEIDVPPEMFDRKDVLNLTKKLWKNT